MPTISYVYKWAHKPTLNWYVGYRGRPGAHPDDGYICSSVRVKSMIKAHPEDWQRTIVATGEPNDMRILEGEVLQIFDARNDPRSFNLHNSVGDWTTLGRYASEEHRRKLSESHKGQTHNKGKVRTAQMKAHMSRVKTGQMMAKEHPRVRVLTVKNLLTGQEFELAGTAQMKAAGFEPSAVCNVAKGKKPQYKGHVFKYADQKDYPNKQNLSAHPDTIKRRTELATQAIKNAPKLEKTCKECCGVYLVGAINFSKSTHCSSKCWWKSYRLKRKEKIGSK